MKAPFTHRGALRGRAIAPIVGAGGLAVAAVPEARPQADANLIRLLRQMLEAFEAERIAEKLLDATGSEDDGCLVDAAYEATSRIVDEIERQRATTIAGLAVKALAVNWCSGDPVKPYPTSILPDHCQNVRLAFGIVDDLLAMRRVP